MQPRKKRKKGQETYEHYEAFSEGIKETIELVQRYHAFTSGRGGKILIVMTQLATGDPAGRALEYFIKLGYKVWHINCQARKSWPILSG